MEDCGISSATLHNCTRFVHKSENKRTTSNQQTADRIQSCRAPSSVPDVRISRSFSAATSSSSCETTQTAQSEKTQYDIAPLSGQSLFHASETPTSSSQRCNMGTKPPDQHVSLQFAIMTANSSRAHPPVRIDGLRSRLQLGQYRRHGIQLLLAESHELVSND